MIKVSVIIPAYNVEKYVLKCLNSIIKDPLKEKEIIIINDGSKDNTLKIIKKYKQNHKKEKITIIDQKNSGQAVARNIGIKKALGEYICFVDSDDFIKSGMLQKMYDYGIKNKSDLVICDYIEYYGKGKEIVFHNETKIDTNIKKKAILANQAPWAKLYSTKLIRANNIEFLPNKYFEDIVIVPLLAYLAENPVYLNKPLYYYNHSNESSIRVKKYSKRLEDIFDSIDVTYKNLNKYGVLKDYYSEIEYIFFDSFLKGAVFRFSDFKEGLKFVKQVREKVLGYFPNVLQNKYYKNQNLYLKILFIISLKLPPILIYYMKRLKRL